MKKKIAIQFSGLIRGFRFEKTRNLIYENLIQELYKQNYDIDIFIHTYDIEYDNIIYNLDKNKFNIIDIIVDSDEHIQNYLEHEYKLEEQYSFYPHWIKEFKYGWFKYYNSVSKVTNMRNNYEKKNNIKYEWVIITSPQMAPQVPIDDLRYFNNEYMYSPNYALFDGYYSSFYIGNNQHINYIGDLYNFMIKKQYKNCNFNYNLINPEVILKEYIDSKYIMKVLMNIRFNRIRYDNKIVDH